MTQRLLDPASTATILLGASDWSDSGLGAAPSFGRSANDLLGYLTRSDGMGLDPDLVIDLFNDRTYAGEQLGYVRDVLGRKLKERNEAGRPVADVIIYYLGHGVTDEQGHLSLLVRRSISGMEIETGIRAPDLARVLKIAAPRQRRLVVLDCCFAEAAVRAFVGMGTTGQSLTASVAKDLAEGLPATGGLLLCSSTANEIAVGAPNAEHTLFTGSLLAVLRSGLEQGSRFLSFTELRDATYQIMLEKFGSKAPSPVLHPFSQAHGDLARYPAFPNSARHRQAPLQGLSVGRPADTSNVPLSVMADQPAASDPRIAPRLQRIGYWFSQEVIPAEDLDVVMAAALEEREDQPSRVIRRVLDSPKARAGDVIAALAGIRDRTMIRKPDVHSVLRSVAPGSALRDDLFDREQEAEQRLARLLQDQAPPDVPPEGPPRNQLSVLGKYEIKGVLGRGAMGVVYDGWDPAIQRRVAIKTVPMIDSGDPETQDSIARFRREAQAAGRLAHPNIVQIYDYGETDDLAYIVMEFIEGESLKQLLEANKRFAMPEIMRIMQDLLAGLTYSHERGVVHRDIKPGNVMLTSLDRATCRYKISDFGIARIESSSMTQVGTMMGTPAYMSPEQFAGAQIDARTDIYASGVLLYQLLTGERPFEGGITAIIQKVLHTDPVAPSKISATATLWIDDVVKKAMAKRSQDRFQTAAAFASALEHAVTGHIDGLMNLGRVDEDGEIATLSAKSASAAPALARRHSGTKAILIFAGVALLVIGYILVRLAQAH